MYSFGRLWQHFLTCASRFMGSSDTIFVVGIGALVFLSACPTPPTRGNNDLIHSYQINFWNVPVPEDASAAALCLLCLSASVMSWLRWLGSSSGLVVIGTKGKVWKNWIQYDSNSVFCWTCFIWHQQYDFRYLRWRCNYLALIFYETFSAPADRRQWAEKSAALGKGASDASQAVVMSMQTASCILICSLRKMPETLMVLLSHLISRDDLTPALLVLPQKRPPAKPKGRERGKMQFWRKFQATPPTRSMRNSQSS